MDADHSLPDSVFVEDPAVVIGTTVLLPKLGHPSRRPEVYTIVDFPLTTTNRLQFMRSFQQKVVEHSSWNGTLTMC